MPKPRKPTDLHIVNGTYRPTEHADRADEPTPKGEPVRPKFLRGKAAAIWDHYAEVGYWLTEADSHALAMWSSLCVEMERGVSKMVASRIAQWRNLASELGFLPGSRSRINVGAALGKPKGKDESGNDPAERHFQKGERADKKSDDKPN